MMQAWKLTGDAYSKNPGDKPWISEMYGYSFACSKSDVWHHTPQGMMLYPGYPTSGACYISFWISYSYYYALVHTCDMWL